MEKLTAQQQEDAKRHSTDRLRAKLCKAGLDEEAVFNMTREDLLEAFAKLMLKPPEKQAAAATTPSETELRLQEIALRKQELQWQKEQLKLQQEAEDKRIKAQTEQRAAELKAQSELREKELKAQTELLKAQTELREKEIEAQAAQREADLALQTEARLLREAELKAQAEQQKDERAERAKELAQERQLREIEIKLRDQAAKDESVLRQQEIARQRARDDRETERQNSLAGLTKRYGDIMRNVLPQFPQESGEISSYFDSCENLWEAYGVPDNVQAKLLLPTLTPKAKTLVSRLSATDLDSYQKVRDHLLAQYRLTPRELKARFESATKQQDETHVLFAARLRNMWDYYLKARGCAEFDALCDLVVADQLKSTMSSASLKYCLGIEGSTTMTAAQLAASADTWDANYMPDGRYRGQQVQVGSKPSFSSNKPTRQRRPSQPQAVQWG
jgi:hypothetical protein